MKEKITSLVLVLVVATSMTVGASAASYIPDDVTYQNLNGQQLAIKTYTLLPDQDPADLYEEDFEHDGFLYSMGDIIKEEQHFQEENLHTEVVTVTTASMCNLHSLPEYVPQDSLNELLQDGITIVRSRALPAEYIVDINKHISNRINNCKSLFPLWLKWEYVRKLFLMPDGLNKKGIKAAAADYYANKNKYPYQVYINWSYMDSGNILYNDKKFVSLLYEANEDYFTDLSKVSDAGNLTKAGIYKFLDKSERVVVVVDCENSDPYKLYATLNNLNQEALLNKICKIILYDDIHTTSAWKILERFTQIPIEHVLIERIKENKSLVDIRLTTGTCREYYQNNVDSFILVSSDSDYWGLISAMPEVRFFVMVESEKCSPTIKNALINAGISYCYIDDFCTGNSNDIKVAAVLREVRQKLDQAFHLNVRDILDEACRATRADMTTAEKNQFYDKYIKTMHVDISPNGEATIVLGK